MSTDFNRRKEPLRINHVLVGVLFFPLGWILGELARWLVEDQVRYERQQQLEQAARSVPQE